MNTETNIGFRKRRRIYWKNELLSASNNSYVPSNYISLNTVSVTVPNVHYILLFNIINCVKTWNFAGIVGSNVGS